MSTSDLTLSWELRNVLLPHFDNTENEKKIVKKHQKIKTDTTHKIYAKKHTETMQKNINLAGTRKQPQYISKIISPNWEGF